MRLPTILVVEDEAIISQDIQMQLRDLHYEPVGATAFGEEAIGLADQLRPDLVLMDIHLAGKMDGIEAAQAIRKQFSIPVVFLTAFAGAETLERARLTEPFGYLLKPFDDRYLQTVIEMALYKHRTESHLRRAYDEQATILRTALDSFFMADWQGRLLDVNESSCRMLGYTREELLRMSLTDLQASAQTAPIEGIEGLKQPTTARLEGLQRRKDGTTVFVEMSVNYLPHAGGRIFCFARDITDRKAAQVALERLNEELEERVKGRTKALDEAREAAEEANRAKAAFLATITHELRTPLNGILGTLDAFAQTNLERDQAEMLDLISESASSLLSLVDDILDFSKIDTGHLGIEVVAMSPQEVVEKACAVVGPVADKAGAELTFFTDPALPPSVLGDPVRLRQVLLNLLNNAVKFSATQKQPQISLRATLKDKKRQEVTLQFEIADNGIGMDENTVGGLFHSFTQGDSTIGRRFGGTGLGLAISKNLIELMGGDIVVRSLPGKGSTFTLTVPAMIAKEDVSSARPAVSLKHLHCLVIGAPASLQGDWAAYLRSADATLEHAPDLDAAQAHGAKHPKGLWVWVFDTPNGEAPSVPALRRAVRDREEFDTRFVLIGRGRRRRSRLLGPGVIGLDANGLRRDTFLSAIASAAGLVTEESLTAPIPIRRQPASAPSREEAITRGQLILVAEDNDVNQKVIRRQLALLGYAADIASGGREALEMWATGDYALLLADIHMPEMDGYQLTAAIRMRETAREHAVIVALTADVLKGEAQQCRDAGLDDYLCKPARLSELKGMLEKWLARRPPVPSSAATETLSVDIAVLEDLVGRDPSVIREFLRAFSISAARSTAELKEAVALKDGPRVVDEAHKLRAPAKSVGAIPLGRLCEELEKQARSMNLAGINETFASLEQEVARVQSYVEQA